MTELNLGVQGPFAGLYSGGILEAIVKSLDIKNDVLDGRTARRLFAGESVNEYNRGQIFEALGQILIDCGTVPESVDALPEDVSMATVTGMAVGLVGERWDHMMAEIQSKATPVADLSAAGERFLRMATVDLALRLFALTRLMDMPLPNLETPLWLVENGGGNILKQRLHYTGLTRDQLAARLEVSPNTVDNWLDGKNWPSNKYVAPLATELASPGASQDFQRELNRHFAFARLADLLADWVGREVVIEMVKTVIRFAHLLSESLNFPLSREDNPNHVELNLLVLGCLADSAPVLLWRLAKLETDSEWRQDIISASGPWDIAFRRIAGRYSGPRSASGLAQDISDVVNRDPGPEDSISETIRQEIQAHADSRHPLPEEGGDFHLYLQTLQDGISLRRSLASRFPHSPEAHYVLGSFLGMAGKHFNNRELVAEGVVECWIASGLLPEWDAPAVECGIILANVGEYTDALAELEKAEAALPQPTPHLRLVTGYVLSNLNRHAEALEQLEAVISVRPNYAPAHSYAAQCAFKIGDKIRGAFFAKEARRLGDFSEYSAWRDGRHSSRRRRDNDK